MAVSNTTKALKDIMRIDAGINGDAQYIEQITWMLFLKAFDYKEQEWELTEKDYYPVIPQKYRWHEWADDDEGITGDALLDHINEMFTELRNLDTSEDPKNRKWLIRDVMDGVNNFMKRGTLLRQVVNKINEDINFDDVKSAHLFNGLYETMLKDLQSAGKAGEFYTPRPVTRFIVEMVAPTLDEIVLDPACGTGGFLTSVIDRHKPETVEDYRKLQSNIKGIEKKPFPYLLCVTNLIAHGIDVPDIRHDNTLRTHVSEYKPKNKVHVIVTNPPFGGAEEKEISKSVGAELRNTETADLFLVHIMELLRNNGRCGLVLPDGFLEGTGVKSSIKKKLVEENDLHTIIRLPRDVFAPYTNINTNLLFFTKGRPTKGVWFYRLEMPAGYKHFSKTRPMLDAHFDPVREWWKVRVESEVSQYIPIDDIIAGDYRLDLCGFPHDTVEILPPDELLQKYQEQRVILNTNIDRVMDDIRAVFMGRSAIDPQQRLSALMGELANINISFPLLFKKSILQAAAHGKLVKQDSRDEPASELLKRVQKEKARLIKERKIKNSKPLPPIGENEAPYDLPEGWVWCRLGDIGTFIRGNGIKRSDICPRGVSCIRYGEIYSTYNISTDKTISFVDESIAAKSVSLEYGDILMTLTGENKDEIGKTVAFLGKEKTVIGGDLATFTNHHQDPMYLSYFMNSPFALLQKATAGTGNIIVHISCDKLSMIPLPLPPLAEQHRIVSKVNELLVLCGELTAAGTPIAKMDLSKVTPFPQQFVEDGYDNINMAARGDGTQPISDKLRRAIDDWDDVVE